MTDAERKGLHQAHGIWDIHSSEPRNYWKIWGKNEDEWCYVRLFCMPHTWLCSLFQACILSLYAFFFYCTLLHGTIAMYALYILKCSQWNCNLGLPCKEQENRQAYCFLPVKGWFTCGGSSEKGIVYSIHAYQIPECSRISAGNPLIQVCGVPLDNFATYGTLRLLRHKCSKALYWCFSLNVVDYMPLLLILNFDRPLFSCFLCYLQIIPLPVGERITSVLPVSDFAKDQYLVMLTTSGYIKRTALSSFSTIRSTGIVAIQLVCLFCSPNKKRRQTVENTW